MDPRLPSLLVGSQVPEHIRVDYPKFVEFLEAYYDFLQGYNSRIEKLRDVNQTSQEFVAFLRNEFVSRYPQARIDDRKLITIIRNLYKAKGTLSAVELLFRIFFNEAVVIQQPGKNILRASDGRWNQEYAISLNKRYMPPDVTLDFSSALTLKISNSRGEFFVEVNRFDIVKDTLDESIIRFYFNVNKSVYFDPEEFIDVIDSNGTFIFRGKLVKSPSILTVSNPGKSWKYGQVIIIKSPYNELNQPTVARVTQVGTQGELLNLEIINYGIDHTENQIITVNPYPVKPATTSWDLVSTPVSINPDGSVAFSHVLTLNSYIEQISETIEGISTTASSQNSYFLENYGPDDYNAKVVLTQLVETNAIASNVNILTDITLEEWLAARTTLVFEYDYVVKYRGTFSDDRGQVSNTNMRLQDNYFYQMFSYVVESTLNIGEYRNALNMIHPAGLKFFGDLAKTAVITNNDYTTFRTLSRDKLYNEDIFNATDEIDVILVRELSSAIGFPTDSITSFGYGKNFVDTLPVQDSQTRTFTKNTTDVAQVVEALVKQIGKAISDSLLVTNPIASKIFEKNLSEAFVSNDLFSALVTKPLSDVVESILDSSTQELGKNIFDSIPSEESITSKIVTKGTEDLQTVSHLVPLFTLDKVLTTETALVASSPAVSVDKQVGSDAVPISDGTASINSEIAAYTQSGYTDTGYISAETILTIG